MKQYSLYLFAFIVCMVFFLPFDHNGQQQAVAENRSVKIKCTKKNQPLKELDTDIITQHPLLMMN